MEDFVLYVVKIKKGKSILEKQFLLPQGVAAHTGLETLPGK